MEQSGAVPKKKPKIMWSYDDEIKLLQIWEQHESELRKCKRNSHVYGKISNEMEGKFTAQEVNTKISNMVQRYRSEKKETGPSGGSPSKWAHFQYVHKIIGTNATNNSPITESFAFFSSTSNSNLFAPIDPLRITSNMISPTLSSPPTPSPVSPLTQSPLSTPIPSISPDPSCSKKRQKRSFDFEILENIKQIAEQNKEHVDLLRNVAEENKNLRETFTNFIQQHQENEKEFMNCFKAFLNK